MTFSLGQLMVMKQHLEGQEARDKAHALADIQAKYTQLHNDLNRRIVEAANSQQKESE